MPARLRTHARRQPVHHLPAVLAGAAVAVLAVPVLAGVADAAAPYPTGTLSPVHQNVAVGDRLQLHGDLRLGTRPIGSDKLRFFRVESRGRRVVLGAVRTSASGSWSWGQVVRSSETLLVESNAADGARAWKRQARITAVDTLGERAVADAARLAGDPYVYGGAGPHSFDCSGLTRYVYGELGVSLPHSAQGQYDDVTHVSRAARSPGDLIFFGGPTSIYHVGIYAGNNMIWHAPHTGTVVQRDRLWTGAYRVGRVR